MDAIDLSMLQSDAAFSELKLRLGPYGRLRATRDPETARRIDGCARFNGLTLWRRMVGHRSRYRRCAQPAAVDGRGL